MKKFIKKIFKNIILLLFVLLLIFLTYTYIYAQNNNTSFFKTLADFKIIGNEFINFTFTDKKQINISTSDDIYEKDKNTSIETSANVFTNNYYYTQLDDNSKIIYNALESNIDNLKNQNYVIDFNNKFEDILNEPLGENKLDKIFQSALDAFFYDHPEVFYIDVTKLSLNTTCTTIGSFKKYNTKLAPTNNKSYLNDYFSSEYNVNDAIEKVEQIKNNFVNKFENCNDYNKILEVHNALAKALEYDSTLSKDNIHNIYGALVKNEVVCEGYAKAFKYILNALDIECILVSGNATNSSGKTESHMWNYVKLNDNWYGVDVTWDDPIIIGASNSNKNNIRRDYFLRGTRTFSKTHTTSGKISDTGTTFKLPTLSTDNYK